MDREHAASIDLDAYLGRIGYEGPREASLEVLRDLQRLHPKALPFENIDPFLHRPVRLDAASLERKMVRGRRGGYCFEHNLLFGHALRAMGFRVRGLAARVLWNRPEGTITPRGHMLSLVEFGAHTMICDVGFGVMTLTGPLELVAHESQKTPHEVYRLVPTTEGYRLESLLEGEWRPLYRFGMEEQFECDYEVTNYYLSTREGSHFRSGLMAARAWEGGRYTLSNTTLKIRHKDGLMEQRELGSVEEIAAVLDEVFLVTVPDRAAFGQAFLREGIVVGATSPAAGAVGQGS
jgi:N-hydroxyarylamine O-acetyltransferase